MASLLSKWFLANSLYQRDLFLPTHFSHTHFKETNIEFRFLPAYAPNLNLIERLWKFLKAKVLSKYYPTFEDFVAAIQDFLSHLDRYSDQLATLMTQEFEILEAAA